MDENVRKNVGMSFHQIKPYNACGIIHDCGLLAIGLGLLAAVGGAIGQMYFSKFYTMDEIEACSKAATDVVFDDATKK